MLSNTDFFTEGFCVVLRVTGWNFLWNLGVSSSLSSSSSLEVVVEGVVVVVVVVVEGVLVVEVDVEVAVMFSMSGSTSSSSLFSPGLKAERIPLESSDCTLSSLSMMLSVEGGAGFEEASSVVVLPAVVVAWVVVVVEVVVAGVVVEVVEVEGGVVVSSSCILSIPPEGLSGLTNSCCLTNPEGRNLAPETLRLVCTEATTTQLSVG
jgi:hypothetical protein